MSSRKEQMLINQFATFLDYKSVLYLFSVIDESSVTVFGQYCLLRIICLYFSLSKILNCTTFTTFGLILKLLHVDNGYKGSFYTRKKETDNNKVRYMRDSLCLIHGLSRYRNHGIRSDFSIRKF